ncbi:MAG: AAA family ATPase [Bacilli bacterium]|nr:AAA family ATPase [Bacilli bacterium]
MKAFEELKETTKKDIIIDGIMRSKGVYLLVSKPKVGKSLFALQLANSIANKKAFLGHEILKPSPVLYITTELSDSQLKDRCNLLGISFEKNNFFVIDRDEKQNINFMDIEYQVKEFAEELNGRILILDMLKDINFGVGYDINSYQDISQKLMPKIRNYADKYNLTILFVHHLNKLGKTLGSTGFDAVVDGIIRLSKNIYDEDTIKLEIINRDYPDIEEYLHKDKNQVFSIAQDNTLDFINPNITQFIKYAIREKEFDFTISDVILKANLMCTPTQLGKLINSNKDLLLKEGLQISKYRTSNGRTYHCKYEEPSLENE